MKISYSILAGLVFGAAVAPVAMANTMNLYQAAYYYDDGGEFTAVGMPSLNNSHYASTTRVGGGVQVFCMEITVEFYPGATYSYSLSQTDSQGRSLSLGAAYLYSQFAAGTLPGYDYANTVDANHPLGRSTSAGQLQSALWWLQGGQVNGDGNYAQFNNGQAGNPFYDLVTSKFGSFNNAEKPNHGAFDAEIMNMVDANGNPAQNQLVAAPDGGVTAIMLGMGLMGLCLTGVRSRNTRH